MQITQQIEDIAYLTSFKICVKHDCLSLQTLTFSDIANYM